MQMYIYYIYANASQSNKLAWVKERSSDISAWDHVEAHVFMIAKQR